MEPEEESDPLGQTCQLPEVKPDGLNLPGLVSVVPGVVAHSRLAKGSWLRLSARQSPCCDDANEDAAAVRAQQDPGISFMLFMLPPFLFTKTRWGRCNHCYLSVTDEKPEVHEAYSGSPARSQIPVPLTSKTQGRVTAGGEGNLGSSS